MLSLFNTIIGGQSSAPAAAVAPDAAYFEPLVFNAIENASQNAAEQTWLTAQGVAHYFVIPYLTYKMGQWFFNGRPVDAQGKAPAQPQQQSGFFSGLWNKAKSAASTVAGKFVVPQVVSHSLNQLWLNDAFWEKVRPLTTSFMRPSFEKLLPKLYNIWDKGDVNFSLREYIPGGPGTWTSLFTAPLRGARSVYQAINGRTFAEKNAVDAYELGKSFANTAGEALTMVYDTVASTKKIGPCLISGPSATKQCISDAASYVYDHTQNLRTLSAPLRDAAGAWAQYGWDTLNAYSGQVFNLANHGLWSGAQFVESKTGIPAHLTYYAEIGLSGYLAYRLSKATAELGRDYLWSRVLGRGRGGVQQINNTHVQPALAQQHQAIADGAAQPGGVGAVAPQQQVVNQFNIGGQQAAPAVVPGGVVPPVVPAVVPGGVVPAVVPGGVVPPVVPAVVAPLAQQQNDGGVGGPRL